MSSRWFNALTILIIALFLLLTTACGGGTTGSDGGGDLRLSGIIRDTNGTPLANTLITLEETGDSAESDQSGNFLLVTDAVSEGHLLLEGSADGDSFSARTETIDLTKPDELIDIEISVSVESGQAEIKDVTVVPVTPAPNITPTPQQNISSTISGNIVYADGSPVFGAKVSIPAQRRNDTSDKFGKFTITFAGGDDLLELLVALEKSSTRIRIKGIPPSAVNISLQIRLLDNQSEISAQSAGELEKQVKYSISRK